MVAISGSFERSSVNLSFSSVVGSGDATLVVLAPLKELSWDIGGGQRRWLEPAALVTGVQGLRPTFRWTGMLSNSVSVDGGYHFPPWQSTRKCMFSEDNGKTWRYFSSTVVNEGAGYIEFRHDQPFAVDSVRVARARQIGPTGVGEELAALAAAYPGVFRPAPSAAAYSPPVTLAFYPAQEFIAAEYSPLQDGSRTIPATPMYTAMIDDPNLSPVGGGSKKIGLLLAGLHSGEDHGTFVILAMVKYLLSNALPARALRSEYRIIVHPLVNARGRAAGFWRGSGQVTSTQGDDPNRHWGETPARLEVVDKPRAALDLDFGGQQLVWGLDSHSAGDMNFGLPNGAFKSAVERAYPSLAIETINPHFDGQASYWMASIGARFAITSEVGDAVPASDDSITAFASGMAIAFADVLAVAQPAPSPAPTPAPAPTPPPAPSPVVTHPADNLSAMTIITHVKPTGKGGGASGYGYLWSKATARSVKRFYVDFNNGAPLLTFGLSSSGAEYTPSVSSAASTVAMQSPQFLEVTHAGGASAAGMDLYINGVRSVNTRVDGAGAINSDAGNPVVWMNRAEGDRVFVGEEYWSGLWNRVLTRAESALVRANGPNAVPDGLVEMHLGSTPAPAPTPSPTPSPAPAPAAWNGVLETATIASVPNVDGSWQVTIQGTLRSTP